MGSQAPSFAGSGRLGPGDLPRMEEPREALRRRKSWKSRLPAEEDEVYQTARQAFCYLYLTIFAGSRRWVPKADCSFDPCGD